MILHSLVQEMVKMKTMECFLKLQIPIKINVSIILVRNNHSSIKIIPHRYFLQIINQFNQKIRWYLMQ
jgi:hypothetical protein